MKAKASSVIEPRPIENHERQHDTDDTDAVMSDEVQERLTRFAGERVSANRRENLNTAVKQAERQQQSILRLETRRRRDRRRHDARHERLRSQSD